MGMSVDFQKFFALTVIKHKKKEKEWFPIDVLT